MLINLKNNVEQETLNGTPTSKNSKKPNANAQSA
jgi:hypothetical protein